MSDMPPEYDERKEYRGLDKEEETLSDDTSLDLDW